MTTPYTTPKNPILQDALGRRLAWAAAASLLGNLLLWRGVAAMAAHPVHYDLKPVEITRIIVQPNGKRAEKVVTKKQIEKKVVQARKEPPKPKPPPIVHPVVHPVRPHIEAPVPHPIRPQMAHHDAPPRHAAPIKVAQLPPPETAHNRIITAPDTKTAAPTDHVVQAGGNAAVGKPMNQQGSGNAVTNPDTIVKNTTPQPTPKVEPKPDPKPALPSGNDKKDVPAPDPQPRPDPKPVPKPDPLPEPKPKKKGPTREAEPTDQTKPDIPDELKHGDFKSFVRVAVDIDTDGSFSVTLRTSSGNPDVDSRVLDALKKWKWKPAMKNGDPISSVQRFKFEFEVQ